MRQTRVRNLIAALGGHRTVADKLGLCPSAVPNWFTKGCVPKEWWPDIIELAHERRVPGVSLAYLRQLKAGETPALGGRDIAHLSKRDRHIVAAIEFGVRPSDLAARLHTYVPDLNKDIRRLEQAGELPRSQDPVSADVAVTRCARRTLRSLDSGAPA